VRERGEQYEAERERAHDSEGIRGCEW
jgi:hypothetical protein